jgi:hypothetical protein
MTDGTPTERALRRHCNADDDHGVPCGRPAIATLVVAAEPGDPDSAVVARVHICMRHLMHLLSRHHTDPGVMRNAVTVLNAHAITRVQALDDTGGRHGTPD